MKYVKSVETPRLDAPPPHQDTTCLANGSLIEQGLPPSQPMGLGLCPFFQVFGRSP